MLVLVLRVPDKDMRAPYLASHESNVIDSRRGPWYPLLSITVESHPHGSTFMDPNILLISRALVLRN